MNAELSRVVVSEGPPSRPSLKLVHHRDFPEIRCEGEDVSDACKQLANQLTRALDSALTNWRRESIQKAISEVQAFATASR